MARKTLYVSKLGGDYKISPHFTLKEFQSRDGADKVLVRMELFEKLEELRAYGGFTVTINSGYRTSSHNKKVGGARTSQHVEGAAADICVRKDGIVVDASLVCCLCQTLGFKGIGYISASAVHVDMRSIGTYRGDERKGYRGNVGGDFYEYFDISKKQIEGLKAQQEAEKPTKIEEDTEMVYKDITEVPEWGRESVQLRLDHGWSDCKNMPETLVRVWVSQDREDPYIADFDDLKKRAPWAIPEVQGLVHTGKLKGNTVEPIGKRLSVLMAVIVATRPGEVVD